MCRKQNFESFEQDEILIIIFGVLCYLLFSLSFMVLLAFQPPMCEFKRLRLNFEEVSTLNRVTWG